jgi:glycerol-3-phosphate dehydrogenase (NAD+)
MRVGLGEMQGFVKHFYPSSRSDTFFESCGVADLITTCFGGRNRKCAEAYARSPLFVKGKALWEEIEQNLLNGQKLQGTLTCEEIVAVIRKNKAEAKFPFFMAIHAIAFENKPCDQLFSLMMNERAAASNGK